MSWFKVSNLFVRDSCMGPSSTWIFETKWGNMANAISRDSLIIHEWFKLCVGGFFFLFFYLFFNLSHYHTHCLVACSWNLPKLVPLLVFLLAISFGERYKKNNQLWKKRTCVLLLAYVAVVKIWNQKWQNMEWKKSDVFTLWPVCEVHGGRNFIHIHIYTHIHVCVYVCMYVYIYTCIYIYIFF